MGMGNQVKPLLSFNELIEKMKELGINFDKTSESEAKRFLAESNYFFKMASFRKNFDKDVDGKYNIDFKHLQELSKLDMRLRYILLNYCLDIEHSVKTYLLRVVTNKSDEDGYQIVQHVFSRQRNMNEFKNEVFRSVRYFKGNKLSFVDGFQKYYDNPPIWVVLEIMTMSKLYPFVKYLFESQPKHDKLRRINNGMKYAAMLRNECAHNRPIIFNLRHNNNHIAKPIYTNAKRKGFTNDEIQIYKVAQIFALLELHTLVCSEGMRRNRYKNLIEFQERSQDSKQLYKRHPHILNFLSAVDRFVDIYNPS
ncbi:Abi family protein [Listeria grandensis]|uniref:Abi family protein n=1 Tax=Listeria grandensis TaxID=1494963 RepID=UPI00164E69D3|nr:Abi family protein [Listeria grandensis]MBC6315290.1 Abi family protein [Listeria grandensis]